MFDTLHDKLEGALKKIRGKSVVNEKDITETMRDIRMALLEADVNFKVAKEFCDSVAAKALGAAVLKSLTPDQQIIKLVQEELTLLMGEAAAAINLRVPPPAIIMLAGLQGSGKTTTAAKLGRWLREEHQRKVLLVPADVYRPAAIEQLKQLGRALDMAVFDSTPQQKPVDIALAAKKQAEGQGFDTIILDTAGRLQIDQAMMAEAQAMAAAVSPHEILLVADAMTGQEAVNVARGFNEALAIDGLILTKLDGDARGGAALSMRAVTGKPIKFVGVGEKSEALEPFHPERMASRILGMGDVLSLIEKASKEVDLEESAALQKKLRKEQFTLEDFLKQLGMIKRMGSLSSLMGMIPGMGKMLKQVKEEDTEKEFKRIEAIILSMTRAERSNHAIINGNRRRRIAKGSGSKVEDVNRLLKQFIEIRKVMKNVAKMGLGGMMGMLGGRGGLPGR